MALLKFHKNICGINQQTHIYLSVNPASSVWDDCGHRHAGTYSSSLTRCVNTEQNTHSKQIAAHSTAQNANSNNGDSQKGYEKFKSKITNMKLRSVQVTIPLKIVEMNKYFSGAFSRKPKTPPPLNATEDKKVKSQHNIADMYADNADDASVYSLEKTITKMNESVLSYYDSTYVDDNPEEVKPNERDVYTSASPMPKSEYLDDDMANRPSPAPKSTPISAYSTSLASKLRKSKERRAEQISRLSLESRTTALVAGLRSAISLMSRVTRMEELCDHLIEHPECVYEASNENVIPLLLKLAESPDKNVRGMANQCMSLMGHSKPLQTPGIRILSIDGGGTRGVVAIEFLKALEKQTGKRVYELFDYVCGVSTGALLAAMVCLFKVPLDQCEYLYKKSSIKTFTRNKVLGTTRLVLNHGFYDSKIWEGILRKEMGSTPLIEFARDVDVPKLSAVSAKVSSKGMVNYLFRNYNHPPGIQSKYPGHCKHKIWQVIRASSAAPGYFEPFHLGKDLHEDGGILSNNPTALAIHESRLLWEKENFHCIVSLGTGRHETKMEMPKLSLKRKISTIVDSACDTEAVHYTIQDLLPSSVYYRFNPYLSEEFFLDEIRPDKIEQMQKDARLYSRRNRSKLIAVSERLLEKRKPKQRVTDWMKNMFTH